MPAGLVFDVQRQSLEQYIMLMEASVELTPEERRRIYEEEKARIDTGRRQVHEEEKPGSRPSSLHGPLGRPKAIPISRVQAHQEPAALHDGGGCAPF